MKLVECDPPRTFKVGARGEIVLSDTGTVSLEIDEQITFKTPSGTELDVVRKDFGYYATPSVNKRLVDFRLRTALVRQVDNNNAYVLLVENGLEDRFHLYCERERLHVICWLSDNDTLDRIQRACGGTAPGTQDERAP